MNKWMMLTLAILSLMVLPLTAQGNGNGGYGHHGGGGNGQGGQGGGGWGNNGGGTGPGGNGGCNPNYNILDGTPFSFSGTVVTAGTYGNEMVVSTSNGNLSVSGLGPNWYWYNQEITKPVVGDTVSGNGYAVDYNGVARNVLTDITVNGTQILLRDSEGLPLWRGQRGGWGGPGGGGFGGDYSAILNGTPFNYEGEVLNAYTFERGVHGNGLVIATGSGNVTLNGLGPNFYWQQLNVVKPVVGDTIQANGYTVDYNGNLVNILMSIVLQDGTTVQLRDTETGAPLWRNRQR
jgi:hypothetical protein